MAWPATIRKMVDGVSKLTAEFLNQGVTDLEARTLELKAMVEANKVYVGHVAADGSWIHAPAVGWTVVRTAVGHYRVTHNLGSSKWKPVCQIFHVHGTGAYTATRVPMVEEVNDNNFLVNTVWTADDDHVGGELPLDVEFMFHVAKAP